MASFNTVASVCQMQRSCSLDVLCFWAAPALHPLPGRRPETFACSNRLKKTIEGQNKVFASVYNMGHAGLNLLLASTIGRASLLARNVASPPGASLLQPVQVWTERTFAGVSIDARSGAVASLPHEDKPDTDLDDAKAMLRALGGRIVHGSRTSPGYGFHYHALKIALGKRILIPVADALRDLTDGAVQCIDASVLPEIGLRPHSLTAMAAARRMVLTSG